MRRPSRPSLLLLTAGLALAAPLAATSATSSAATPKATYKTYVVGTSGGEPTLGYDIKADRAVYGDASGTSIQLAWDAKDKLTTKDVTPDTSDVTSLDPITFTDRETGRTFVSQLYLACSFSSFSDNAGASWTPSQGCGAGSLVDHQTIGGGPYTKENAPLTAGLTGYPHAVYYCAQNSFSGACSRSDDGGITYGAGIQAYNVPGVTAPDQYGGACSAIHGHLRVAPDGIVYLPNKSCGGTPTANNLTNSEFFGGAPAVSVSEDNGTTWTVRKVNWPADAHSQEESDPSIAADKASTVFFGWQDGTNPSETVYGTTSKAKISVSKDHGKTWTKPYDVSSALGLKNVQFPTVIAGDPGRAAFSFLGTKGVGDDQHNGFVGEWHLYVATTVDNGKTWSTVDATPGDPVQRGCISLQGTSNKTVLDTEICDQRNLLDFTDITYDRIGRVLVSYADGCVDACVANKASGSKGSKAMVLRQATGPLLLKGATVTPARPVAPGTPAGAAPVAVPRTTTGGTTGGALAATGGAPALAAIALLLIGGGVYLRRRRN